MASNILFITRAWSKNAGGMERLSYEMTQAFSQDPEIKTTIIAHQGSRKTSPFFIFTCLPKALLAAKQADVIHLGDPLLSFTGWLLKNLTKKPIAVSVHGLDVIYSNPLYQAYLSLFFKSFDLYLPISQYAKQLTERKGVRGRITVINPGITDNYYDPAATREDLSNLLNQNTQAKVVLVTSGRLVKRKGHAWFIEHVLPHLPSQVIYGIAGTGSQENHLRNTAAAAGVQDRVVQLGRVTQKQLKTLYNTCDAFIQPNIPVSHDSEGFGLVLLEAATCAKPIFASHIEGITDAIQNGKNGRLLPAQDAKQWIAALNSFVASKEYTNKASYILGRQYTLTRFSWATIYPLFKTALIQLQR